MQLSESSQRTLLLHPHETISECARLTANHIKHNRPHQLVNYPPNGVLTEDEKEELTKLADNENLRSALQKVLASNAADVFFDFLNIIDGTGDPQVASSDWEGVLLIDYPEEEPESEVMLHDEFYSTYWDWVEITTNRRRGNSPP